MHLTAALVVGVLSLQSSAFLVPLEISKAAEEAKSNLEALLAPRTQTVDLDCPGCPFAGLEEGEIQWQHNIPNRIRLEFNIDDERGLSINGISTVISDPLPQPIIPKASQIRIEDGAQTVPVPLDFALERLEPITSHFEPDKMIIPIHFTILGLAGHPVKVDTLAIDILQTFTSPHHQGKRIARISQIPFKDTPGASSCDTTTRWSICRLRAIISSRLQNIIDAAKSRASTAKGWMKSSSCSGRDPGEMVFDPESRLPKSGSITFPTQRFNSLPGHHHGHHGHHHHHRHRISHMIHQAIRFFITPALLGIIGGLMASAIGMLVGQMIVYMWIRFHRGGRRGNASRSFDVFDIVVVNEDEGDVEDINEKDVLLKTNVDVLPPPPQYKDVENEEQEK